MKYIVRAASFTLILVAAVAVFAQGPAPLSPEKRTKLEAAISSFMSRQNIPALSVAIAQGNEIRFVGAYGIADLENFVPTKSSTVFRIASTTKPLTAVAAMQLFERGKLDLDAPVQKYVPSFPTKSFPITTRQLLAHVSGIRNYKPNEAERTDRFESLT